MISERTALRTAAWSLPLCLALAGCDNSPLPAVARAPASAPHTSVLGSYGQARNAASAAPSVVLNDANGRPFPAGPAPAGSSLHAARVGPDAAVAVWVQAGHATTSSYLPATGWSPAAALETIHGEATDPQVVSNGKGAALAVWQHSVGSIQSLRYSRFDGSAWGAPDVVPGALPRPPAIAGDDPLELRMDDQGNVFARWPSGFPDGGWQTSQFSPALGWARPGRSQAAAPAAGGARHQQASSGS